MSLLHDRVVGFHLVGDLERLVQVIDEGVRLGSLLGRGFESTAVICTLKNFWLLVQHQVIEVEIGFC